MQYFYVTQHVDLRQSGKLKQLIPVSFDDVAADRIPLEKIYCGPIAWEYLEAQRIIGENQARLIHSEAIPSSILPLRIRAYSEAGDIVSQLQHLTHQSNGSPIRIALINGTGTMLGDTLVGSSVLAHVFEYLHLKGFSIEIDVYCAWNARPGVAALWQKTPGIRQVFDSSPSIAQLQKYQAYWDYTHLLRLPGYSSEHFGDFYCNHFGINPACVPPSLKLPSIRVDQQAYAETQNRLSSLKDGNKLIFLQPEASTSARSMPDALVIALIKRLCRLDGYKLVTAYTLPKGLTNFERGQVIDLEEFTKGNLDRYLSAIAIADSIISVDTLAIHVAMGCNKPGVGLFSLSEPSTRLKYSPQIEGLIIPFAQSLPYWGIHKSDDRWNVHKDDYERSWMQLPMNLIIEHILRNAIKSNLHHS